MEHDHATATFRNERNAPVFLSDGILATAVLAGLTWLGAYAALTAYGRHSTVVSSLVATLEARIIAVCDAWAAMRVNRPYSRALTDDQAREQLVKGRGSQFDPTVVDAFLSLLDEGAIEARDPAGRRAQIPSSLSRSRSQT